MTKTEWTLEEALAIKGPTSHTSNAQLWAHIARLRKRQGDTAGAARAILAASTAKYCVTLSATRAREERAAKRAEAVAARAVRVFGSSMA